ncbi:hypothetical protein [Cellulophaga sp. Hel_I_12]|nr:hypothetical protein [Cellulophaga sp. Hel_I_12]
MKATTNSTSIKQKEIIQASLFSIVIAGYVLYHLGHAVGTYIAQIGF